MSADEANQSSDKRTPPLPKPLRISANKALLVVFGALLVALIVLIVVAVVNYSGAQKRGPAPAGAPAQPAPAAPSGGVDHAGG